MPEATSKATVTGATVRVGDGITIGGIPHTVTDVRDVPGGRKRFQFADGNSYVLARRTRIDVTRAFTLSDARDCRIREPATPRRSS